VEAFNPLLRSLLGWKLVERVDLDDGSHRWELSEGAQHRLDDLTPARQRAVTTLAYLDHSCNRCRQQRLTHLVDDRYLCVECQRLEDLEANAPPAGQPVARRASPASRLGLHRDPHLRWNH
jgi:hypothetical protein